MKRQACPREAEVLDAAASGRLGGAAEAELRAHVAACPDCADAVLVARSLNGARQGEPKPTPLPTASFLWWKFQIRARREAAERAAAPVAAAQRFSYAVPLAALVAIAAWQFPRLAAWLAEQVPPANLAARLASFPGVFGSQSALALACGVAFFCLLGLIVYTVLVRD